MSEQASVSVRNTVFAVVALSVVASGVLLPVLAPLVRSLHLTVLQAGWMLSIGSLTMAVAAPLWGLVSDRGGRRLVILLGFAGMAIAFSAFTAVAWFGVKGTLAGGALFAATCAARTAVGFFLPAVPSAAQALMADHTPADQRAAGMAVIGAANGAGLIAGPMIGGVLAMQGLFWPLLAVAVLYATGWLYAARTMPAPRLAEVRTAGETQGALRGLGAWLLAGTLTWLAIATAQLCLGFYFQDQLHLSNADAGPQLALALTLVGIALFGTQLAQLRVLRWQPERLVIAGALAWIGGLGLMLLTAHLVSFLAAYALFGVGAGLLLPGFMAGASLRAPAGRQGAVAGLSAATQGVGFIVAPVASTALYEMAPAYPVMALAGLMVLLMIVFLLRDPRSRSDEAPIAGSLSPGVSPRR